MSKPIEKRGVISIPNLPEDFFGAIELGLDCKDMWLKAADKILAMVAESDLAEDHRRGAYRSTGRLALKDSFDAGFAVYNLPGKNMPKVQRGEFTCQLVLPVAWFDRQYTGTISDISVNKNKEGFETSAFLRHPRNLDDRDRARFEWGSTLQCQEFISDVSWLLDKIDIV